MSVGDIRKYLTIINSYLRNISHDERRREMSSRAQVYVGYHSAPSKQIQDQVLAIAAKAMPKIYDNKCRGALGYYLINSLHMFQDGNGRTSRAVYMMLTEPSLNLEDIDAIAFHRETESYGHEKFEHEHHLASTEEVLEIATNIRHATLVQKGKIDERLSNRKVEFQITGFTPELYFTTKALSEGISADEQRKIRNFFLDINISTLAMEQMLTLNHQVDRIISAQRNRKIIIPVEIELDTFGRRKIEQPAARTFDGWGADDYRKFSATAAAEQYSQNRIIIDMLSSTTPLKSLGGQSLSQYVTNFPHDHQ